MSILIVEPDNKSAEIIYDILKDEDIHFKFASDGMQGLVACRKFNMSVVIIDFDLPLLDSLELVKILKDEKPHVKIIIFFENYSEEIIEKLKSLNVRYFLKKEDLESKLLDLYKMMDF